MNGSAIAHPAVFERLDHVPRGHLIAPLILKHVGVIDKRSGCEFGVVAKTLVLSVELLGGGFLPGHEIGVGSRFGQRISRNVRRFARTSVGAEGRDEFGIRIQFEDDRFVRSRTACAEAVMVVPARIVADGRFVQTQNGLDVVNAEFAIRCDAVRELFRIGDLLAGDVVPGKLVAAAIVFGSASFRRLNGQTVVEVVVDACLGGLVAAVLNRTLNQSGSDDDVFRVGGVHFADHEVVRDVDDFIVLNATRHPGVALVNGDLPGFVLVCHRVGAAFGEVAVFAEQFDGDVDGLFSGMSAFGHQTADAVADAAVLKFLIVVVDAGAGVGDDDDAGVIDKTVGEGGAVGIQRLRPVKAQCFGNLRNLGGRGFVRDHFAGIVLGRRYIVLRIEDASAVVFVVADDDMARCGNGLADDHGGASKGVDGNGCDCGRDGAGEKRFAEGHF